MTTTVEISADQKSIAITYTKVVAGHSTEQVEQLLSAVGLARSGMLPPVPEKWTGGTVKAERDPRWSIESDALAGDALLHLRDHHLGWRHYIITKAEARKLGEALIARASAEPPAPAGRA